MPQDRPKRYAAEQRNEIRAEARAKWQTEAEVATKFGVAAITYHVSRSEVGEQAWHAVGRRAPRNMVPRSRGANSRGASSRGGSAGLK